MRIIEREESKKLFNSFWFPSALLWREISFIVWGRQHVYILLQVQSFPRLMITFAEVSKSFLSIWIILTFLRKACPSILVLSFVYNCFSATMHSIYRSFYSHIWNADNFFGSIVYNYFSATMDNIYFCVLLFIHLKFWAISYRYPSLLTPNHS